MKKHRILPPSLLYTVVACILYCDIWPLQRHYLDLNLLTSCPFKPILNFKALVLSCIAFNNKIIMPKTPQRRKISKQICYHLAHFAMTEPEVNLEEGKTSKCETDFLLHCFMYFNHFVIFASNIPLRILAACHAYKI